MAAGQQLEAPQVGGSNDSSLPLKGVHSIREPVDGVQQGRGFGGRSPFWLQSKPVVGLFWLYGTGIWHTARTRIIPEGADMPPRA